MSSIPPVNHWDDWSWAESDSEEEFIPLPIEEKVAEVAQTALTVQLKEGL